MAVRNAGRMDEQRRMEIKMSAKASKHPGAVSHKDKLQALAQALRFTPAVEQLLLRVRQLADCDDDKFVRIEHLERAMPGTCHLSQ